MGLIKGCVITCQIGLIILKTDFTKSYTFQMHPLRLRMLPLLFRDHISREFGCSEAVCCHISHRVAEKILSTYLGINKPNNPAPASTPPPICAFRSLLF